MTVSDITSPPVLLTGPTSGIGAGMLDTLLAHPAGPNLVLLARDRAALDRCPHRARSAGVNADGITVDLGDPATVQSALTALAKDVTDGAIPALDVAILNAGAQFTDRRRSSSQGWKHLMPAMSVVPGATTPGTSSRHAVELAMGDRHVDLHDGYIEIGRLIRAEPVTYDAERRAELWRWLEQAVTKWLPEHARIDEDEDEVEAA